MGREIVVPAGETRRILWIYSSSIPGQVRFRAEPLSGEMLSGKVELRRQRWFNWKSETHDLSRRHVFDKGMSDGDFRLFVTPDQDTRITFETRHFRAEIFFRILIGMLALAIVAGLLSFVLQTTGGN